jgi:hypothetical protein
LSPELLAASGYNRFIAWMKIAIVFALSILLIGCTSLEVRQRNTAELKARFVEVERELASYHPEETDRARLNRYLKLTEEEHSIERELFRRCRAGDHDACLPHFHLIAADI